MTAMRFLAGLPALAALALALPAAAAEYTATGRFDFNTVGDATEIGPNRTLFAGALDGTYVPSPADAGPLQFATIICPGYVDLGVSAAGYCIVVDDDGDRIFLSYDCNRPLPVPDGAVAACEGDTRWLGGTGKFLGIGGGGSIRTTIAAVNSDGTLRGYIIRDEAYILPDR